MGFVWTLVACRPGDSAAPESTTLVADPCAADPAAQRIVDVSATVNPIVPTEVELTFTLTHPGWAQARCVADDDPTDVVWGESTTLGDHPVVPVAGLVLDAAYTCDVAATCGDRAEGATGTTTARAGPSPLPETPTWTVKTSGDPVGQWTFFNYSDFEQGGPWSVVIGVDLKGRVRWLYDTFPPGSDINFEVQWTGAHFVFGGGEWLDPPAAFVDVHGRLEWSMPPLEAPAHHQAEQLYDGSVLALTYLMHELEDGTLMPGLAMSRVDPTTDAEVWWWDTTEAYATGRIDPQNHHSNWATIVDEPGGEAAYLSTCFSQDLIKIDVTTGAVRWVMRWDGFTLLDETGAPTEDWFQCQHGVDVAGNRLLMVDNGVERGQSRLLELEVDEGARTAQIVRQWTVEGWESDILGDADYLPDDHVLVLTGTALGMASRLPTSIYEVAPDGGEVWSLRLDGTWSAGFRAARVDGCEVFLHEGACPSIVDTLRPGPLTAPDAAG